MLGDTNNSEDVEALAISMGRLVVTNTASRPSNSCLGSPILSSADSYNLTVEECTLDNDPAVMHISDKPIVGDMAVEHNDWLPVNKDNPAFLINRDLFRQGILVAIKPDIPEDERLLKVSDNSFSISSANSQVERHFTCCTKGSFLVEALCDKQQKKLCLVDVLPAEGFLQQHEIYIQQQDTQLLYAVLLDNQRVVGTIDNINISTEINDAFLDHNKHVILNSIHKKGHIKARLYLVETLPIKGSLKQHEIYIQQQGNQLLYAVLLDKQRVVGVLNDIVVSREINQEFLDNHQHAILSNIYKNGHLKNIYLKKIELLLDQLQQYLECQPNTVDIEKIIVNLNRREEIFFPVILHDASQELGFYVYPWIYENIKDFKFSGFTRFVTAGCMFGTGIKAVDYREWSCNFIKHNLPFGSDQKICDILLENSVNCYEQTLFHEMDKLLLFVDKLSEDDSKKQIYYHLPFYDYMLFGVELFNNNRIKLSALNKFFEAVMNKREEHINNIRDKCIKHGISCVISSPFENLFEYGELEAIKKNKKNSNDFSLARYILSSLGMCKESCSKQGEWEYIKYTDDQLINIILDQLNNNNFNLDHQEVWRDFVQANLQNAEADKVRNIDDLFKAANAIMVAIACKGQQDYKVCALHTLSEKPISVNYGRFRHLLEKARETEEEHKYKYQRYAASFNMTVMEPALGYSNKFSNGLLFCWSNTSPKDFDILLKDRNLLLHAHQNIAHITKGRDCTSLNVVLP